MNNGERRDEHRHPIRVVAQRTALSAEVLRAWERRYGVVEPLRTETGQRLYSDADIERLRLLRKATLSGRAIGLVAEMETAALASLVREDEAASSSPPDVHAGARSAPAERYAGFLEEARTAVRELDGTRLETVMMRALVALDSETFLDDVAVPLLRYLGSGWAEGTLSVAHEHLASGVMRRVLGVLVGASQGAERAPALVAATPARQVHEFGALLAGAAAGAGGWRVYYLGADLPARDIATAARTSGARAVALSLVFPDDDPEIAEELRRVRGGIGWETDLIVGGAAAAQYSKLIAELGGRRVDGLPQFRAVLS
jgi:MerR family transcriptional regulator, light-induced transcriptional regulator